MSANFYSSNTWYLGFASQAAFDTPAASPSAYLRADRAGSSSEWQQQIQTIRIGYGDVYGDTDTEVVNPVGQITVRHPLTPTTLNAFLLLCGIPTGAASPAGVGAPQLLTFFCGAGPNEDVYLNAQIQRLRLSVAKARNSQRAMLDMTFAAGDITTGGAPRSVATLNSNVLTYERPYHLTGLSATTLIGSSNETTVPAAKIESVQLDVAWTNPPQYLGRSDGRDRVSDFTLVDIGATLQLQRSYNSNAERAKYLAMCSGYSGATTLTFSDECSSHTLTISIPNGRYTVGRITAPDRDYVHEALTVQALRNKAGTLGENGSDANSVYAPIGFAFT